jgi:hypothetical protein
LGDANEAWLRVRAVQNMAEENAKLFKRMVRAEAAAKNAAEQMQLAVEQSAARATLAASLQTVRCRRLGAGKEGARIRRPLPSGGGG